MTKQLSIPATSIGQVAANSLIGNSTGSESDAASLSVAQTLALLGVETGATADQTGAEIVSLIDTELGSSVWQSGGGTVDVVSNVAASTILGRVTSGSGDSQELSATQVRTLLNVEDGSTANATDADLRDRTTHTGAQAISTVTGLQTALDGKSATGHTHIIANVTGLQTALDGKATSAQGTLADTAVQPADITAASPESSPVDTDDLVVVRSGGFLRLAWTSLKTTLKTYFDTLYGPKTQQQLVFLSASGADATAALGVIEFAATEAMSLTAVEFRCDTDNPPTGSAAQMDLLLNGTTIFSTNPTIDASESSSTTAATAPVLSTDPTVISAGANLEFDLDQVGASNAGQGYYAILYYTRSN